MSVHYRRISTTAAGLAALGMIVGGCDTTTERPPEVAASPAASTGIDPGALVSRVRVYGSVEEMAGDSALVLVAHVSDEPLTVIQGYGDPKSAPLATLRLTAVEPIQGRTEAGDIVRVAVESSWSDGQLRSEKFTAGETYLVFLTPLGNREPGIYAVTGYVAGMFQQTAAGVFSRVDADGPDSLPATLSVDDVRAATG